MQDFINGEPSDGLSRARGSKMGRPKGSMVMTHNRRRILAEMAEASARGERISLAELARRTGLDSYRDARRTIKDIKRMGALIIVTGGRNE